MVKILKIKKLKPYDLSIAKKFRKNTKEATVFKNTKNQVVLSLSDQNFYKEKNTKQMSTLKALI